MKIGPIEIGRIRAAEIPQPRRERGASGTILQDGLLVQAEYNNDLRGQAAIRIFDRMRRSDASVREALQHIVAPIRNATWEIEAASDEPEDLEVAEFVRRSYFEWPAQPFLEHLTQALLFLTFGHQVFERVEQVVEDELEVEEPDGTPRKLPRRQFLTLRRFAQRLPETIYKWNVEDGELVAITQRVYKDGNYENIEIPAETLLVYTHEREGDDLTGISLLRSAYKAWVMKELTEKVALVAVERHGVGTPVAYVPTSAKDDDALMDRIEEMLQNLRSGEFNYLVFPGPKALGTIGGEGFTFEIASPSGGVPDFTDLLEYCRGEIKGNVLARFAELGHGSTGARATGDVQSEVWYDALHAVARQIGDSHDDQIRRLVDANYTAERYPKLVAHDIESRNLTEFADSLSKLVASAAVLPDKSLREFAREAIGAPDEDDDAEEQLAPEPLPPIEQERQPGDPQPAQQTDTPPPQES